jgi:hypothetical protein
MRYHRLACSLSLLALPVVSATGQTPTAAANTVDGRRLRTGSDTLAIYLIKGTDTVPTGTVIDQLRVDGEQLIRVYSSTDQVLGNRLDTIVSRLADLRPVSYHSRSPRLVAHLVFATSAVDGWLRVVNGDSVPVRVPLAATVYDAASFDLVARASDLRDNRRLAVPSFFVGSNTVGILEGRVDGSMDVDSRPCWVFKAVFQGMPVVFWIDKETRALRRQLLQVSVDTGFLFAKPRTASPRRGAT